MKKVLLTPVLVFSEIFFVFAATDVYKIDAVWQKFLDQMVNPVFTLLIVVTFTYFLWGLLVFLYRLRRGNANDEDIRIGYNHMVWGGAGLLIIVSISGIIRLLSGFFNSWFS